MITTGQACNALEMCYLMASEWCHEDSLDQLGVDKEV